MLEVEFDLYGKYENPFLNLNEKATYIFYPIFLLGFSFLVAAGTRFEKLGVVMVITSFVIIGGFHIYSFFTKYESTKQLLGKLIFTENYISWNKEHLSWIDLTNLVIERDEIEFEILIENGLENNISDGINEITLTTKDKGEFHGWYKLPSAYELQKLNKILTKAVYLNKLDYQIAFEIIKPKNYKSIQELKDKIRNE